VPAYVVFHDSTLRAIAQARPASLEALRAIPGLGERKLANYGAELLAVVAEIA
jgi:ATP-dependent DNA helicase RecQ